MVVLRGVDHDVAVRAGHAVTVGVPVGRARLVDPARQVAAHLEAVHHRDLRLLPREIEELTADHRLHEQRGRDRERGARAGDRVPRREGQLHRLAVGVGVVGERAGVREAVAAVHVEVEVLGAVVALRPRRAERRDRGDDQLREAILEARVVQPQPLRLGRRQVLDEDVCLREQIQQQLAALVRLDVEAEAELVGVEVHEREAALAVLEVARVGRDRAGRVTLGVLDLDHLGAEVGEQLAGVGRGEEAAVLDDRDAFQQAPGGLAVVGLRGQLEAPCCCSRSSFVLLKTPRWRASLPTNCR